MEFITQPSKFLIEIPETEFITNTNNTSHCYKSFYIYNGNSLMEFIT